MPRVDKTIFVPFTVQQMYALINDIEAYPEFLPWCKTALVHTRSETQLEATLCIGKGLVKQTITTLNTMIADQHIQMQYQAGPFKYCHGAWNFITLAEQDHCQVQFAIDYEFSNQLTALTMEPLFTPITNNLIDAFFKRAQDLYGKKPAN